MSKPFSDGHGEDGAQGGGANEPGAFARLLPAEDYSAERCARPNPVLRSFLRENPLEVVTRLCTAEHYDMDRGDADSGGAERMHILVPGYWCDHEMAFLWDADVERLSLTLVFDGRVLSGRADAVVHLLGLLNARLESGRFDYLPQSRAVVFRDSLSLAGGATLRIEQAMDMVAGALDAAELGHPAFQYVIWAGDAPEAALERAALGPA